MAETTVFKRNRSAFWMRINEDDDGSSRFFVSLDVSPVVKHHFPELESASQGGWKWGNSNTENIFIPSYEADQVDVDEIKRWAEFAGNQCVWLKNGKHLTDHFDGTEMEFCIAADFNFATNDSSSGNWHRSDLGEAEYQLKYHLPELTKMQKQEYAAAMSQSLLQTFDLLPLMDMGNPTGPIISSVPTWGGSNCLAGSLARHVADRKGLSFVGPRLRTAKPQMKNLAIGDKVAEWTSIYNAANSVDLDSACVRDRDVVIIDDLYQSGVTMWAYARKLKACGARGVFGLVCVKSMRDSDNQ